MEFRQHHISKMVREGVGTLPVACVLPPICLEIHSDSIFIVEKAKTEIWANQRAWNAEGKKVAGSITRNHSRKAATDRE